MIHLNLDLAIIGCNRYAIPSLLTLDFIFQQFDFTNIFLFTDINLSYNKENVTHFKINPIRSRQEYNKFILKDFYSTLTKTDRFLSSHVMFCQWDGFPIHPENWIDDFLHYDYIGAPWKSQAYPELDKKVGNGGFSIRSYKFLKTVHDNYTKYFKNIQVDDRYMEMKGLEVDNEDVILSIFKRPFLESKGITYAPFELASRFSFENFPYNQTQFGFHGIHRNTNFLPDPVKCILVNSMHLINKVKEIR